MYTPATCSSAACVTPPSHLAEAYRRTIHSGVLDVADSWGPSSGITCCGGAAGSARNHGQPMEAFMDASAGFFITGWLGGAPTRIQAAADQRGKRRKCSNVCRRAPANRRWMNLRYCASCGELQPILCYEREIGVGMTRLEGVMQAALLGSSPAGAAALLTSSLAA